MPTRRWRCGRRACSARSGAWLSVVAQRRRKRRRKLELPDTASEEECAKVERAEELTTDAEQRAKKLANEARRRWFIEENATRMAEWNREREKRLLEER